MSETLAADLSEASAGALAAALAAGQASALELFAGLLEQAFGGYRAPPG